MKRIGDVLQGLSIPINTAAGNTSVEPKTYKCDICKDAHWLRVDAEPGHPNFGRVVPCQCLIREQERKRNESLLDLSHLQSLSHLTFETFDSSSSKVRGAYNTSLRFAQNPEGWLFFHGNCGVGKTHLAASIANHVIAQRHVGVYFRVVPDLLDQLRATFDPQHGVAYDERFQQIKNAGLLVLDDLGTEQTTPWASEKLYQLINHRYNEQLPTIVTSNQDFSRLEQRVLSRLLDTQLSQYVLIDTDDYRLRQHQQSRPR